ncbi:MAG: hypothetical protein JXX28_06570 [Deltaproteobacteria bacterium]|nr:hypothetical protein [Deltaproteobacteria bacterium]
MKRLALTALALTLSGCADKTPDDTAVEDGPLALEPGAAGAMDSLGDRVAVDLAEAGTYWVVLMSQAPDQSTTFGYGSEASAARRVDPTSPLPAVERHDARPMLTPAVGDTRTFRVHNGSTAVTVTGEVIATSDQVVVWRDTTTANPLGDLDMTRVMEVVDAYGQIVLPRERAIFGEESDVDGGGTMDVLLSYTVNQTGAAAYVSGCDIGVGDCGTWGNGAEIMYMGIPEDDGHGSTNGIVETFAHEHNHLVYDFHKYALNGQEDLSENVYVTEGMSALAQDLTGYNNGNQYVWAAAIDMQAMYGYQSSTHGISINDVFRGSGRYDAERDGPLRGAAYLFLRYMFEQAGGMTVTDGGTPVDEGGIAWLHDWFSVPELGPDAVLATTGRSLEEVGLDAYTALLLTGRGLPTDPAHTFQPRFDDPLTGYAYGVDPFANIHGWLQLTGVPIQPLADADGALRAGGVEYLEVVLDAPGRIEIPVAAEAMAVGRVVRAE